ncbi:MAG: MerR family transcriptional regulator [Alphaproteobacteria bacterium]
MTGQFSDPSSLAVSTAPVSSISRPTEMKSPTAFRTISEVATDLSVPQHVLRFWESKFQQIRPLKRGGGRRYYRPEDVQLIGSIKDLLYNQGFTIRGVQKLLKENGRFPSARSMVPDPQVPVSMVSATTSSTAVQAPAAAPQQQRSLSPEKRREIEGVLSELKSLRELLRQSGI